MDKQKLTAKTATYPLPESAPKGLVFAVAIAPFFMMLATSYVNYTKILCNTLIFTNLNAMAYYALVAALGSLAGNVFQPIFSKLGDLIGRKKAILMLAVPLVASVLMTGLAKSTAVLAISSVLTGMTYGTVTALINGMIADLYTGGVRAKMMGYNQTLSALGGMVGPMIAGAVSKATSAATAMIVAAVVAALASVAILLFYPDVQVERKKAKVDWAGVFTLLIALGPVMCCLTMGGSQIAWFSPLWFILLAVSVVGIFLFVKAEQKSESPIIYLNMFKSKAVRNILFFELGIGAISAIATQYFNVYCYNALGFDSTQVGLLSITVLIAVVLTPLIGVFISKTGKFKLVLSISSVFALLMCVLYYFVLKPGVSVAMAALCKTAQNIASCCALAPVNIYFASILPANKRGVGLGLIIFSQTFFTSLFIAVFGAVYNAYAQDITAAFAMMTLICAVIVVARLISTLVGFKSVDEGRSEMQKLGL